MACPERGKPAKNVYFINRPQKQDKPLRRLYGKRSAYPTLPLWMPVFLCAVRIFPNKKTAKHPKGNHAIFPRFVGYDSAKAFYGIINSVT